MAASNHYVHNLSEFIFKASDINFSWVTTWWGIALLVLFFAGGFTGCWWFSRKLNSPQDDRKRDRIAWINMVLTFLLLAFGALFTMNRMNFDWGLRWYSTMYLLGYVQVYIVASVMIKNKTLMLTYQMLDSLILYLFLGMLVGARLFYVVIYNWKSYIDRPLDMFKIWEGGLSFHGGIVGVVTAFILFSRQSRVPFWHLVDRFVLMVPFGIGMGRLGNFMNGELWGRIAPDSLPWAVVFPRADNGLPIPRHPSQLYQSLGEGWLLLPILYFISRKRLPEGAVAVSFLFFYAFNRFFMEFFREADAQLSYYFDGTLTMGQILCFLFLFVAIGLFFVIRNNPVVWSETWRNRMEHFFKSHQAEDDVAATASKHSK